MNQTRQPPPTFEAERAALLSAYERHDADAMRGLLVAPSMAGPTLLDLYLALLTLETPTVDASIPPAGEVIGADDAMYVAAVRRALDRDAGVAAPTPVISLATARMRRGHTVTALATQLELGPDVLLALERGAVDPNSLPVRLLELLGAALELDGSAVEAALRTPTVTVSMAARRPPGGASSPQAGTHSFAEVVRGSGMPSALKANWEALCDQ
jgi:hypothetical protein